MREKQGHKGPTPKDSKKLDLFSWKVYSTEGFQLRIAKEKTILRRYNFNSWNPVMKFKELVPTESNAEFGAIVDKGKAVAQTSLEASLDDAGLAVHTLSLGIAMKRSSWLQASRLPPGGTTNNSVCAF